MKKFFLAVAALAMLATSCTKDETTVAGGESLVSFTIDSPELATRADGDGEHITHLQYAFYNEDGILAEISKIGDDAIEFTGKTTIQVYLVEGRTYSAIFWADNEDAPYTVTFDEDNVSESTMTINNTAWTANSDIYDAFYKFENNIRPEEKTHRVELTRPFAQINIATADTKKAEEAGVIVKASKMAAFQAYTTLNLVDGTVSNKAEFTYSWATIPTDPAKVTVNGQSFDMLAMNYVLVNTRELMDKVTLGVSEEEVSETATYADAITREYTTVPVKRNYRTYIVGNLLTTPNDFEVETKPGFEDDDEEYGVIDGKVYQEVENTPDFIAALEDEDIDMVILTGDINLNDLIMRSTEDTTLTIAKDREFTIDLGGHKLSATSAQTGKNYNMFDVRGTLTVKNGTIEYKHEGENMGWNNFAEIFYVGFNGTLNLEGVTAKNLGGSDMAYVIDMVNATNITVNVKNSTLESTYIPVRVFNNSKTGVNNVSIKNSTLKGKFCFWVQYWLADGRDEATLKQTLKLDILNGTNTFECTGAAPILYGFNETIYYSVVNTAEELTAAFTNGGHYALNKNIETEASFKVAKNVVLDLAGNTISGTDKLTVSYALIEVQPDVNFEITNTAAENGKLTVVATNERNWNAFSSVVSNQRGTLTVGKGVVIEHFGGTAMAYGIDNLTNTGNQKAIATINGATVKSPYRAIRQFLNSTAEGVNNELYVNSGVIEGANKSIWMQNANAGANPGKLVVEATAQLKGDVFVSGSGAATLPVEVSVASAALVGESTVLTSNVPVQYEVVEVDGTWIVKENEGAVVSTAAELTAALDTEVSTIFLAAGDFGTIVAKSNKTIIGCPDAKVDCVNLNGADNVTLKNITFDAATAKMACNKNGAATQPANIVTGIHGGINPTKGARNLTIEDCTFAGTFVDGGVAIAFTDQGRTQSGDITIKGCTFDTKEGYADIYVYYGGYGYMNIENNTFKTSYPPYGPTITILNYQSSTPIVVKGNTFENQVSLENAMRYTAHSSGYTVSVDASNNTFAN